MPRDLRIPLIDGDRCVDDAGNVGSARKCLNRTTREWFIGVKVIDGPEKGTWGQPYRFRPVLNHEGGTLNATCERCGRPFLARARVLGDLGGYTVPRDTRCLTCHGLQAAQRPEGDTEDYVGSYDHKTKHHAQ